MLFDEVFGERVARRSLRSVLAFVLDELLFQTQGGRTVQTAICRRG
jgi:hypothetical protein